MNNLKNGNITSVLSGIGATSGSICKVVGFKYCLECIEEDKKTWEKAYLHRSHQVDGNYVCFKHNTHLQVFEPPKNDIFYNIHNMRILDECIGLTKPSDELLNLAKDIDFVLLNHEKFESYEITREKYYSRLLERGYSSDKGLVEQVQLHSDFLKFYSNDFLSKLESIVDPYDESSWLRNISRRKLKTVNPLRNLMFIRFLFGGLIEFIEYKYQKVSSFKDYRSGIDGNAQKSVKEYKTELREPYMRIILDAIEKDPNISRRQIRIRYRKEHMWLEKYEKEWLESIMPAPLAHSEFYVNSRVDWTERDSKTCEDVKNAIYNILDNDLMERVSITHIAKNINYKGLKRDIDKMPRTKELLDSYVEDLPTFHKRKIHIAYKILLSQQKDKIKPYMLLRLANIDFEYYHDYDEYINSLLQK